MHMQDRAFYMLSIIINRQLHQYDLVERMLLMEESDFPRETREISQKCKKQRALIQRKLSLEKDAHQNWRDLAACYDCVGDTCRLLAGRDKEAVEAYERGLKLQYLFIADDLKKEADHLLKCENGMAHVAGACTWWSHVPYHWATAAST